jgi:Mlc titration factor MtfA (ptsG expression regulator)
VILKALRHWREQRAAERHAIPDALWQLTLLRYPFLARRSEDDLAELRRLSSLFLSSTASVASRSPTRSQWP